MDRLFGADNGKKILTATQKLRTAVKHFGESVAEAFGFEPGAGIKLESILDSLSEKFTRLVDILKKDVIPFLGPIFLAAIKGTTAALNFLTEHMNTIAEVIKRVGGFLYDWFIAPFKILSDLLHGNFGKALDDAFKPFRDLESMGKDLKDWILDIAAPQVKLWAEDLWAWLRDTGAPAFFDLLGDIKDWILDVAAPAVGGAIKDAASTGWEWLKKQYPAVASIVGQILDWTLNVAAPKAGAFIQVIASNMWEWLQGAAKGIADIAGQILDWTLSVAVPKAGAIIKAIASDMWSWLKGEVPGISNLAGDIKDWILNIGVPQVVSWVTDVAGWLRDKILGLLGLGGSGGGSGLPVEAGGGSAGVTKPIDITGIILNVLEPVANFLDDIWESVKKCTLAAWELVKGKAFQLEGAIVDLLGFDCNADAMNDAIVTALAKTWAIFKSGAKTLEGLALKLTGILPDISLSDLESAIRTALDALAPSVSDFAGWTWNLAKKTPGVIGDVTEWIVEGLGSPSVASFASWTWNLAKAVPGGLADVGTWIIDAIHAILTTAVQVTDVALDIVDPILNVPTDIAKKISDKVKELIPDGVNLENLSFGLFGGGGDNKDQTDASAATGIATTLEDAQTRIDTATSGITTTLDGFTGKFQGWIDAFKTFGTGIGNGIIDGINAPSTATVGTALGAILNAGLVVVDTYPAIFKLHGKPITDNLSAGLLDGLVGLQSATKALVDAAVKVLADNAGLANPPGKSLADNYAAGITGGASGVSGAADGLVSTATGALVGGYTDAYYSGTQIGQGYADGINSMITTVQTAANALAVAGHSATQRADKQNSPSKVYREFGRNNGLGYALGFLDSKADVIGAAKSLSASAQMQQSFANTSIPRASLTSIPGRGMGGTSVINVTVTGNVMGADAESWAAEAASKHIVPALVSIKQQRDRAHGR
jgi:hypothetical protein